MASGNSSLVVKVSANIDAMKAALQLGEKELIKVAGAATALAKSMDGAKLEQNAKAMAVAITTMGGATQLTAAEAKKADATFQAWFEKAAKSGKAVSPELQKIAAETKRVTEETKKAEEETRKLAEAEKRLAEEAKKAGEASGGFFAKLAAGVAVGTLVADALKKIGEMAVQAFTSAAMAVPNMIKATMDLGGSLFDMSLKTGASVENLSRLRYVSSQTGISMDSFVLSMSKMQMNLGQVGAKSEELRARLSALGLNLTTLKNSRPDEAFISVMSALEKIPNRADQAAAGMAIFGKGFKDMAGLTQESITELLKAADDLGLTLSTELAAASDLAGDALARIKMQWEAFTIRIGAAFLPAVIGLAENISTVLGEAITGTNGKLDAMGRSNGFLATVARAMGTGNEAIAAQAGLYEILRDAIISFVRGAVQPTLSAMSYLMVLFNASKVVYLDVVQVLALLATGFKVAALGAAELLNVVTRGRYLWEIQRIRTELGSLVQGIEERSETLRAAKAAEDFWADGAKQANDAITASLDKLATTQIDVGKMIADNAAIAKAAAGGMSTGLNEATDAAIESAKKLETLNDESQRLVVAFTTLREQGQTNAQVFDALGSQAAGLQAKFAALGTQAPADVQKVVDALKKFGTDVNIAKWMQQQAADIRKILEDSAKSTEALATRQREAINKGFVSNLDVAIKAEADLTAAKGRATTDRIAFVKKEMEAVQAGYTKGRESYEVYMRELKRLEEQRYRDAVAAIQKDVQARRDGVTKGLSTTQAALDAIAKYESEAMKEAFRKWLLALEEAEQQTRTKVQRIAGIISTLGKVFDGINDKWGQAFQIIGQAFDVIGSKTATFQEKVVAGLSAASGILNQFAAGSVLAAAATGALSGASAGAALAMLSGAAAGSAMGAAFAGVGAAVGALVGALMSLRAQQAAVNAENEKAQRSYDQLKKQLMEMVGTTDDLRALSEAVGDLTANGQDLGEVIAYLDAHPFSGAAKLEYFADAYDKFVKRQADLLKTANEGYKIASQELLDYMAVAAKLSGELSKQAKDYYLAQLGSAATGLTSMFAGLQTAYTKLAQAAAVKLHMAAGMTEDAAKKAAANITGIFVTSQAQATGLGAAIAGTFGEMIAKGATFAEAFAAIKGPLDTLRKQLELTGLQGGAAFEHLSRMGQIADGEITGPLMNAITGANAALQGLHNSGILNQEMFAGIAGSATEAYNQIIAQGADGQAALAMMQPTLQTIWKLQQDFGYETDAATQALIDQAVEAGMVGAAHMSAADQTAAAMNRVVVVLEAMAVAMGVTLPASAETGAKGIQRALDGIKTDIAEPWADWDAPPEIKIPYSFEQQGEGPEGMASGGVVYAAGGWMQPKGSDIVPAMLTPGERVLTTGQNYDYEHRMRTDAGAGGAATQINITIQALDPAGLKQVVEKEVAPLLVSAYRRNVNGLRTDTRKELVE